MIPSFIAGSAFVFVILTLIGYLIAAREGRKKQITHPDDYFLARNRMTSDDFGDTQIAYALQMSTVYPFFILAAAGAWVVPILNSLFWFVGIFLFMVYVQRFTPYLGRSKTIHAFIANANSSVRLRRFASALTIIAFSGVVVFEIVYGATVFRVLFSGNLIVYYLIIAFLAAYLTTYIWNGGQTATLRTEQFQLLVAYLGIHFALAHIFFKREVPGGSITPSFIPLLVLILCVVMLWTRGKVLIRALRAKRKIIAIAYILMLASLLSLIASLTITAPTLNFGSLFASDKTVSGMKSLEFWMMIGTAILIPIFWQFVDLTNWQRICSLTATTPSEYASETRKGFWQYLIESPLSWLLAVLLGLLAPPLISGNDDPFELFIRHFLTEPGLPQIAGIMLVAGIVGVFMSTADAAITAIGYAFAYDFYGPTRDLIDKESSSLSSAETAKVVKAGRLFMATIVGVIVLLFILLDWYLRHGPTFVGLLFAFYTPVISFSPAVLCPIWFNRSPRNGLAFVAILVAATAGLGLGVYSAFGHPEVQWYPAPVAFGLSWLLYLLFMGFAGKNINPTELPTISQ
jgi:hypothetical protein